MEHLSHYAFQVDLPEPGRSLLVHGLTGMSIEMDSHLANEIESASRNDGAQIDIILGQRIVSELRAKGLLTQQSQAEEESELRERVQRIGSRLSTQAKTSFWITPTYNCQLRCTYCFMFHPSSGAPRELHIKEVITHDLVDAAFRAMAHIQPNPARRTLRLFGGDPLQRQHSDIVVYILERARALGYATSITSNCVDLDAFLDYIDPSFVSGIVVSLDGSQEMHDKQRVLTQSMPTFEKIVSNISAGLRKGISFKVRIQVSRATLSSLPELADRIAQLKWFEYPNFHAEIAKLRPPDISDEEIGVFLEENARNAALRRIASWDAARQDVVLPILLGKPFPQKVVSCGKQTGMYIFDALGKIYDCPEMLGYTEHAIGEYDVEGFKLNDNLIAIAQGRWVSEIPECMKCPFVLMCGGGCEFESKGSKPGSMFPYKPACDGYQGHIKGEIRRAHRKLNAFKVLSDKRANSDSAVHRS